MRTAGRILQWVVGGLMVLSALGMIFQGGRNYERTSALRAVEGSPIKTITKKQAAARNDPICRTVTSRKKAVGR